MLTKLVALLSCTICFLGIIAFNYFQEVQSIDLSVVYSLGGVTIMGNSVIDQLLKPFKGRKKLSRGYGGWAIFLWKFQRGGGFLFEIPSVVGVWIFSGTTHSIFFFKYRYIYHYCQKRIPFGCCFIALLYM